MTKYLLHKKRLSSIFFIMVFGFSALYLLIQNNQLNRKVKEMNKEIQALKAPTLTPVPTSTPTPTDKPKAPVVKNPQSTTGCSQFRMENGPVYIRVILMPESGAMIGRTSVRIKPSGSCPNESSEIEHWMEGAELSWTSPDLNPGRYRIEIANGNYQGVVTEYVNVPKGGYEYKISIRGQ